ncbi:glycosyltransferase [Leeuwenhoekiella palythoae]|uniref:glycosyltransferase family 2 protein n=1 Tax=Leeuwenhoekiella palythoae TaxID=573501 RepID=UPI001CE03467|nr:glycosyltransferase [Leeuwenhoekiella palythoae]UBZ11212.1 glycosyltransferase [Leeuwenhoekiella palythoae]
MDLEEKPLVSVLIPTFNRYDYLREAINSIVKQSYKEWEVIVVDDGSDKDVLNKVLKLETIDRRVKIYQRPDSYPKGVSGSRNYAFSKSNGDYIQWLDDDDLIDTDKLEVQVEALEQINDSKTVAFSSWGYFNGNATYSEVILNNGEDFSGIKELLHYFTSTEKFLPLHSYLIPRNLLFFAGEWNVNLRINLDAEYMLRILMHSSRIVNVSSVFCWYRSHDMPNISGTLLKEPHSFTMSLRLMSDHLHTLNISCKPYFRQKMFRVFYRHWGKKRERSILLEHRNFFKEHGINFKYAYYYILKFKLYQLIMPKIKRYKS